MKLHSCLSLLVLFLATRAFAAGEHCPSAYLVDRYVPAPGVYQKAAKLVDPAGEQTALFDLSWGGIRRWRGLFGQSSLAYGRDDGLQPERRRVHGVRVSQ